MAATSSEPDPGRRLRPGVALVLCLLFGAAGAGAQPDDLESWSAVRSPHFTILSNAEPARAGEIARSLERFRAVFSSLAPALELRSPVPTEIFAFRDAAGYAPYKTASGDAAGRVLGQFLSHRDGNYITLDAGSRLLGALPVVYHEYVHYLVRNNLPAVPLWFHEGLAEYYSTFVEGGETAVVGRPVERHVAWLQRAGDLDLESVLAATDGPEAHRDSGAGRFYAVSWALVHYLLSGDDARLGRVADYLIRLHEGEAPERAFAAAFAVSSRDLERRLREYVAIGRFPSAALPVDELGAVTTLEVSRLEPAETLTRTGRLALHLARGREAERHFDEALENDPEYPEAIAGLAAVRAADGRLEEADLLYREAVGLGTRSAVAHLEHGRLLLARMEAAARHGDEGAAWRLAAEARQAFGRAVELDPDFAEAEAMLGASHLYGDADPARGIPHLARASERLPARFDLEYQLAQLHLRHGDFAAAERLVEGRLARRGPPELLWRAREELERARLVAAANEALGRGDVEAAVDRLQEAIAASSDSAVREELERQVTRLREAERGRLH